MVVERPSNAPFDSCLTAGAKGLSEALNSSMLPLALLKMQDVEVTTDTILLKDDAKNAWYAALQVSCPHSLDYRMFIKLRP
ncbi:MAG: hypothetical protein RLZZ227_2440 [Pseudomonadota bacterium]|jgi:hypothetical protein